VILVPISAFGNVLGQVTLFVVSVVDFTEFTTVFPGGDAVQANVELLAIGRVSVTRMSFRIAVRVQLLLQWALESIIKSLFADAVGASSIGRPGADTGALIKDQVGRAGVDSSLSVNAGQKLMADSGIFVLEEAVFAFAFFGWLGILQFSAVFAVDIVHMVALVVGALELIKDKTILAQFSRSDAIHADVVQITLNRIGILAILGWTFEHLSSDE